MHHALSATFAEVAAPPVRCGGPEELTPEQRAAVEHGLGPLMVFAGPGAGKTRTITHRIAHLLASEQADPTQILAGTFTVAAASEMRERLAQMLGIDTIRGLTVATFHSVCARMLRTHAGCFGRGEDYTIYDQNDLAKVVGHLLCDNERSALQFQLNALGAAGADRKGPAAQIVKAISLAKNRLWTPEHYVQHSQHPLAALIGAVWAEAEAELRACNAFDFDDLLVYGVRLLAEYPQLLTYYRARWRWMLVDEFQDTNYAQMALVSLVAGPNGNLTVVADDDQLLYSFRGAQAGNVLGFRDWFPGFRAITLGRNYRCRAEILSVAVNCVRHNLERVPKQLVAMRGCGGRVETPVFGTDRQEAEFITGLVVETLGAGVDPDDILLIARNAYVTVALQQTLAAHGIPYRVLGALGLFERAEVKDAVAYLRLLSNPCDGQALRRAVAAPKRGVGPATANRVIEHARHALDGDLIAACCDASQIEGIRQRGARDALTGFGGHLEQARRDLAHGRSVSHAVVSALMMPGGPVAHFKHIAENEQQPDKRRDAERVLEDLRSLCRAVMTYAEAADGEPSVAGFLENACGLDGSHELDGEDVRITISTIHRSKGMEAHLVVLIGCEERLLPSWRSIEDVRHLGDAPSGGLQEERRLFYVAATRAKDRLVLTQSRMRGERPSEGPSRFLTEAGLI
jgi:DNA helicase-2/ATP-dependent DNA helicase PcrA